MFIRNAALLTLAAIALAGCGRDDVKVYHVAKDDSVTPLPNQNQIAAPEQNPPTQPQQQQLQWTLPSGWQEIAPSQMRVASFAVTNASSQTADVSVIPLPAGENEIDLINMWRDQVQLPATTNSNSETVSVGNDSAKFFEVIGTTPMAGEKFSNRILVAELTRGETSWFFKMTGEDSFVAAQKPAFVQFLKSVNFAAPAATTPIAGASLGTQNSLVPNANTLVTGGMNSSNNNNSIWTIPADWQQLPPSQFLLAEFSIAGTNGATAEVNVAELSGEGGGLAANVNRWRRQLGLPAADETEFSKSISTLDIPNSQATLVDLSGTDFKTGKPTRLVGAIVPQNGQTWFYKLMGDETVVAQQKDAFIQFIQSAKYPNAR
jgi:hypothetical protein